MSYQFQPLGTIISSVMNYDLLCSFMREAAIINNVTSSYAPCDGRSIEGSALEKQTRVGPIQPDPKAHIKNAPDLRGKFLRGLNTIYSTGELMPFDPKQTGDPQPNRMVADFQSDAFKEHQHGYTHFDGGRINDMSDDQDHRKASYGNMVSAQTDIAGGDATETRPRNIAVYFYIKIN